MHSANSGRVSAWAWIVAVLAAVSALVQPARAHGDHDRGPLTGALPSPRVVAVSEQYQLVGIVEGEVLVIYLDRFSDNAPVTTAMLEVTIDDRTGPAELQRSGTYEIVAPRLKQPGSHEVVVSITDGTRSDLLVGSVTIPPVSTAAAGFDHSVWAHLRDVAHLASATLGLLTIGAVLLVGVALLAFRRRGAAIVAVAALGLALATPVALAHDGHDHGPPAGGTNGNAPQRRPDGSIFLPKPTQRLLEVRTRIIEPQTTTRAVRFIGRIVANPNRSGVVQSTIQGRFMPAKSGVPTIGVAVKAGDLLGSVAPSFVSKESADMAQTLGELDQQITLTRAKLARQETLLRINAVAAATVEETRIQLQGLLKRREDLLASKTQPEELRAPVDGVITAARVVAGQVVSQTDVLFSIIDPASLMVEALLFDQLNGEQVESAVAQTADGVESSLRLIGRSRTLQQQYTVLKFEVLDPGPALNIGTPVTITGRAGAPVSGIILPRAAVAQAPNGQMVVFSHKEPEIFEPKAVRFEPFDAQSVLVLAGVEKGDKIVVQGAPLVNQVR